MPERKHEDLNDLKEEYPDYFPSDEENSEGKGVRRVIDEISSDLAHKHREINRLNESINELHKDHAQKKRKEMIVQKIREIEEYNKQKEDKLKEDKQKGIQDDLQNKQDDIQDDIQHDKHHKQDDIQHNENQKDKHNENQNDKHDDNIYEGLEDMPSFLDDID